MFHLVPWRARLLDLNANGFFCKRNEHSKLQVTTMSNTLVNAPRKASKTETAADKAVARLKSLQSKGNASNIESDAIRKRINSEKKKAAKCNICIILAEDDAKPSSQNETAVAETNGADTDKLHVYRCIYRSFLNILSEVN